jgi:hypothetical protein
VLPAGEKQVRFGIFSIALSLSHRPKDSGRRRADGFSGSARPTRRILAVCPLNYIQLKYFSL